MYTLFTILILNLFTNTIYKLDTYKKFTTNYDCDFLVLFSNLFLACFSHSIVLFLISASEPSEPTAGCESAASIIGKIDRKWNTILLMKK